MSETAFQMLALADEEPLTYGEDPDAIDDLVALGLLVADGETSPNLTVYRLTAAGHAALRAETRRRHAARTEKGGTSVEAAHVSKKERQ